MTREEVARMYERFAYAVLRRCLRVTGDRALAEDALQDVFVRVLRYGNGFDGGSALAWLHRIADRACLDRLERDGRRNGRRAQGNGVREHPPLETAARPTAEATRLLSELLQALPRPLREVAILYYVDDMTQDEIARALACSTMTVRRRLAALHERSNELALPEEVLRETRTAS